MGPDRSWVISVLFPLMHLARDINNWHGSQNSLVNLYQFKPAFSWRGSLRFFNPPDDKMVFTKYIIQDYCQKSTLVHCKLFANIQLVLLDTVIKEYYSSGSSHMLPERRGSRSSLLPSNNLKTANPVEERQLCRWMVKWTCHTVVHSWDTL